MAGVERWRNSGKQDSVIGSAFAFMAQACGGQPRERMEPIDGAGEFRANLQEPVVAGDVREFMGKYDATALFRPMRGAGRQHDDGAEDSPRERHGERIAALQKAGGASDF